MYKEKVGINQLERAAFQKALSHYRKLAQEYRSIAKWNDRKCFISSELHQAGIYNLNTGNGFFAIAL